MKTQRPKQICFFTAPTVVSFHLELGRSLKREFPEATITFVTCYSLAAKRLKESTSEEVIYFPDRVKSCLAGAGSDFPIEEFDQRLFNETRANINLMLMADKNLGKMGARAEELSVAYVQALNEIIQLECLSICRMYDCFFLWLASGITLTKGGWPFGFVSNGIPSKSTLALKTPFEAWDVEYRRNSGGVDLAAELAAALKAPPEERMHYMTDSSPKKLLPAVKENLVTIVHLLKDASTGIGVISYSASFLNVKLLLKRNWPKYPKVYFDIGSVEALHKSVAPFVFFPLQYEPEASIMSYSPWFREQTEALRLAAQALPVGWHLLVKEHPMMMKLRPRSFYRKLKSIPNLRLANPQIAGIACIEKAKATFCITGSATFESQLLGTPGYCLGRPPFSSLLSQSDLASAKIDLEVFFKTLLNGGWEPPSEDDLRQYLGGTLAAHGCTMSVGGVWKHNDSPENVAIFLEYIARAIQQE